MNAEQIDTSKMVHVTTIRGPAAKAIKDALETDRCIGYILGKEMELTLEVWVDKEAGT